MIHSMEGVGWMARRVIWYMIFGGVFERHPGLKLAITETPGNWWPATAAELDSIYDLTAVKETLVARLRADGRVLAEPPPQVFVKEWADDKRVLTVAAWTVTADHLAVQQDMLEQLGRSVEALRQRPV